jgi:spore coat polysaccharide biosynthesis protein SpsF
MPETAVILQVRISSTRLPGKLLMTLCGKSIFEHILLRLMRARTPQQVVIATTNDTAPLIQAVAKEYEMPIFVGSEEDVLERYVQAAETYGVKTVIRATGDNPLVSIPYIDNTVQLFRDENADLALYPLLPYGTGVEVIRSSVLEYIHKTADDPFEREHITQYIYRHDADYKIVQGIPEEELRRPDIRLTIDTMEDYLQVNEIYSTLYKGSPIELIDVLQYLDSRQSS